MNPDSAVKTVERSREAESWSNEGVRQLISKSLYAVHFIAIRLQYAHNHCLLRGTNPSTSLRKGFASRPLSNSTAESGMKPKVTRWDTLNSRADCLPQ
jgi:hypothetical protein